MAEIPKHTLVYLGKLDRFDRDQLLEMSQQIVHSLGLAPIIDKIYEHNELNQFISHMKGNEAAVVPMLETLGINRGPGVGTRFYINERKLYDSCQFIVCLDLTKRKAIADTITVRSDAGRDWYTLLAKTGNSLMKGQALKTKDARARAKSPRAKPGLVADWELKECTADYITVAKIWGNLNIVPAERAIDMFPFDDLRKASKTTISRIFGSREECLQWLNENL